MESIDIFIVDFDSTFVNFETLDAAIALAVSESKNSNALNLKEIEEVNTLAMEGKLDFASSLDLAIKSAKGVLKLEHFLAISNRCLQNTTKEIIDLVKFVKKLGKKVFIMSGGFETMIKETANFYGVDKFYANREILDENDFIVDYDKSLILSGNNGKSRLITKLKNDGVILPNEKIIMIGDGNNDIEVYEKGISDYFMYFAVNSDRNLDITRYKNDKNFFICRNSEDMNNFLN